MSVSSHGMGYVCFWTTELMHRTPDFCIYVYCLSQGNGYNFFQPVPGQHSPVWGRWNEWDLLVLLFGHFQQCYTTVIPNNTKVVPELKMGLSGSAALLFGEAGKSNVTSGISSSSSMSSATAFLRSSCCCLPFLTCSRIFSSCRSREGK